MSARILDCSITVEADDGMARLSVDCYERVVGNSGCAQGFLLEKTPRRSELPS
jgi:hypothetical protein